MRIVEAQRKFFLGHSQPSPEISGFSSSSLLFGVSSSPTGWGRSGSCIAPCVIVSFLPKSLTLKKVLDGKKGRKIVIFSSQQWTEVTLQLERKPNTASSSLSVWEDGWDGGGEEKGAIKVVPCETWKRCLGKTGIDTLNTPPHSNHLTEPHPVVWMRRNPPECWGAASRLCWILKSTKIRPPSVQHSGLAALD